MDIDTLFADAIAGDADAIAKLATIADCVSKGDKRTILHTACSDGNTERVKFIVTEFANKNLLVKVDSFKQTPLHIAADGGYAEVVEILIDAARRIWPSSTTTDDPNNARSGFTDFLRQANYSGNTALHEAVYNGHMATVELLLNADPNDRHILNRSGDSPMYLAIARAHYDIIRLICKTCTAPSLDGREGTTSLHLAINEFPGGSTHEDLVMVLMDSAKRSSLLENGQDNYFEDLFSRTDPQNQTLLSLAVLKNHPDAVKFILKEDPAYEHPTESKYSDLKSLISAASREGYTDIVKILCKKYEAGKSGRPCHDLLIEAIEGGKKELVHDLLEYDKRLVLYYTPRGWGALHYAAFHKFNQIIDAIINAQNDIRYERYTRDLESPLLLAAKEGFTSTLILLINLLPDPSFIDVDHKGQNIMHIAVVQNNKYMIQSILAYFPELWIDRILDIKDADGNTPLHLLISHGCFVPELIKHNSVYVVRNKQNWTPSDMLYFQEEVTADQVKIKILLDDIQATRGKPFWRINIGGRRINLESSVPRSKRLLKDIEFGIHMNKMMEEEHEMMKKKVKPYRERTTTQIIVTALITTVTFTVGFTMPGGYHQSGEPEEGLVLLSKKKAFEIFMVSDASALALSITSLFIYFISSLYDDPDQISKFDVASTVLNIISVIAMILTFIAGIYVVLSHSPGLALIVCIICSTFFLSLVVLLAKMMYDGKKTRKIKV